MDERLIYSKESPYHRVLVYQKGSIRTLRLGEGANAGKQSSIDLKDLKKHLLEYTKLSFAGLFFVRHPKRILIIGLGGGVIPRQFHDYLPDAVIDIVDTDPDVFQAARKFFFFEPDNRMRVHLSDGRLFVLQDPERSPGQFYDLIVLDAFQSDNIPLHMTSREFFQQLRAILHSGGVVVANMLLDPPIFHSQLKTFRAVFGRSYVFMGRFARNAILISPGPDVPDLTSGEAVERAARLQKEYGFDFDLISVARQFRPRFRPNRGAKILTDENLPSMRNPR